MEYKISVIMPVYNAAKFLKEAMDSLIGQTIGFENLQVIMVDDCSTDESPKMMAEYAEEYSNVEMYKTEVNSGAAGTPRNIGLEHVKAPYIMFLDSDDFYDLDACRALYKKINETGMDFVGGYYCTTDIDRKRSRHIYMSEKERIIDLPQGIMEVFNTNGGFSDRIYDSEFIKTNCIQFTRVGFGEDTAFTCKCLTHAESYIYIPVLVVYYRHHDNSVTHVLSEEYFEKCLPSIREIRSELEPFPEVMQWKMGGLSVYYLIKSIDARNLDRDALIRIYQTNIELFSVICEDIPVEYKYALKLIGDGKIDLAADYVLAARAYEDKMERLQVLIQKQENRIIFRIADAISQRRFYDALKICFEILKKRCSVKV